MKDTGTHYCFGGYSHNNGCSCECSVCISHKKQLAQKEFNEKLNQKIKLIWSDFEFRRLLAKELLK